MDSIIILCAGSGSRAALGYNKLFYPLGRASILDTVIGRFQNFGRIILTASESDFDKIRLLYPQFTVVKGGATRTQSVRNALSAAEGSEIVAIHDGARPFVLHDVIENAIKSARETGSGIPAVKSVDSVCISDNFTGGSDGFTDNFTGGSDGFTDNFTGGSGGFMDNSAANPAGGSLDSACSNGGSSNRIITDHLDKSKLYNLQTPQCFDYAKIRDAYDKIKGDYADDSEVYKLAGYTPVLTEGSYQNKKLTTAEDFVALSPLQAIGCGFDVHELVEGRRLILGGVHIPYDKGLNGHSDADVLLHALTDAILSAANKPDIGALFPDTDPDYRGIDSFILLDKAAEYLSAAGKQITSFSCVLIAQKPKLMSYIPQMRSGIAQRLKLDIGRINISATTTEFLGIVGEGRAIAASAAVLCSGINFITT